MGHSAMPHPGWIPNAAALSCPLVAIAGKTRLEIEALERQGRPQQVASEPLETSAIVGSHGHRIVGRKARGARLPGLQQFDPLVGEQISSGEKGDHLVPEHKLGGVSVDPRHRVPCTRPIPASS